MATKFVYSGAVGTNDGSSWANAWTSIVSAVGVAAGDVVKVHKTHSQVAITTTQNFSNGTTLNPVRIICVDKDAGDALATGALIEWNANNTGPQGNIYFYGMTISSSVGTNGPLIQVAGNNGVMILDTCKLQNVSASGAIGFGGGGQGKYIWRNNDVDISTATGTTVRLNIGGLANVFEWYGGTYTCKASQVDLFSAGTGNCIVRIYGVVFNGTVTNFINSVATTNFGELLFSGCKLPTFTNLWSTIPNGVTQLIRFIGCTGGTISVPSVPPDAWAGRAGTVVGSTSRYRSNGADDGEQANDYSWEVATTANAAPFFSPVCLPPLNRWVEPGSNQTLNVYVASGGTLNNDDVWIEVLSPSEAGSPTSQARFQTTLPPILAANAAIATDSSSTWTGSGTGTKQVLSVTISPTVAGRVQVRVYVGKASNTIYIDPVIELAGNTRGRSRLFESQQVFSPIASANLFQGKF